MALVHLVRHGQASFGADDYDELSALGERQSRLLGEWMRDRGEQPTRIVIGPLKRHRQTAEACLDALGARAASIEIIDDLRELDHLDILGRQDPILADPAALRAQMAAHADPERAFQTVFVSALQRWVSGQHDDYVESWRAFQQRCRGALATMCAPLDERDAAWVFTSGGPIAAILQHVLEISDARMLDLTGTLVNSGVTRLRQRGGRVRLDQYNTCAHLERHADAGLITYR